MRLLAGAAVVSVLISGAPARAQSATPASGRDALVGTWRFVSFEDVENGKKVHRYGEKPLGLFIYTPDGHVAIQIANPAKPACAIPAPRDTTKLPYCTPEQARALLEGYAAYWGTYTVDANAGVVRSPREERREKHLHRHRPAAAVQAGRRPPRHRGRQDLDASARARPLNSRMATRAGSHGCSAG